MLGNLRLISRCRLAINKLAVSIDRLGLALCFYPHRFYRRLLTTNMLLAVASARVTITLLQAEQAIGRKESGTV